MDLKLERLDQGEKVAAAAALVLFACMFLSWFNFGFVTWTAWEALHFIAPLLAIAIFTTLGCAFATLSARSLGDLPSGLLVFVFGCLAALLILFRLIDPVSLGGEGVSTSASVEAGAFLGFVAAIGIAVGGYMQTNGEAVDKLRRLLPSGAGVAPAPSAAAPAPPAPAGTPAPPEPAAAPETPAAPPPAAAPEPAAAPRPVAPSPPAASALPPLAVPSAEAPTVPAAKAPAVAEASAEAFCEHCGTPMRAQDRFCRKCGRQQSDPSPAG